MKRLFYILIIVLLFAANSLFAKSGIEIGIFVPLGMGIGINSYSLTNKKATKQQTNDFKAAVKQADRHSGVGFDAGALFHIGYRFEINKDMSVSVLGELGYSHDEFVFYRKSTDKNYKNTYTYMFESLAIGIYPKFNWKKFSFGLNVGMKIPLYAKSISAYTDYKAETIDRNIEHYNVSQMKEVFNVPLMAYLRFSVDYSIYTDRKFALVLGGYIGGNFGMSLKSPLINNQTIAKMTKQTISSFDIGFQVGVKILPNN
ncbi:outer membrane beta-barrel protein [Brachyspira murdochii]|uniref:Outer membrane protein beta-barrel domain-containing protein n=1 Tax=Brachyspira murdochii (strain ATCC 51284 / DSM 12563 / 56-150) TaxID=526224 RepID=D5U485_BRAM5|nr:outer membrane beta-barrel protein [Brachyspira murdochii]ADG72266.1 conserved hypothetical protein [Brachyspira murdochii DSM 12563]